jgi:hypothetical protein
MKMARKYRIKTKADKHYPQYKFLFWWEYFHDTFYPKSGTYSRTGRVYYHDFKKAKDVIQKDKRKRFKKTTIVK